MASIGLPAISPHKASGTCADAQRRTNSSSSRSIVGDRTS